MGVRILYADGAAALYCSTTEIAFGPLFLDDKGHDGIERAEAFLNWLAPRDARLFTQDQLLDVYQQWRAQEAEQWKKEDEAEAF